MVKTIVWDLEGVLIVRCKDPIVHPNAVEVLEKSRQDFDRVYLWTLAGYRDAYRLLHDNGLLQYFDRLIGQRTKDNESRDYMIGIENGRYSGKAAYLRMSEHRKDLRILGGRVEEKVLMEDVYELTEAQISQICTLLGADPATLPNDIRVMKNGYPLDRVVHIGSYNGSNLHSLIVPYGAALEKFAPIP